MAECRSEHFEYEGWGGVKGEEIDAAGPLVDCEMRRVVWGGETMAEFCRRCVLPTPRQVPQSRIVPLEFAVERLWECYECGVGSRGDMMILIHRFCIGVEEQKMLLLLSQGETFGTKMMFVPAAKYGEVRRPGMYGEGLEMTSAEWTSASRNRRDRGGEVRLIAWWG